MVERWRQLPLDHALPRLPAVQALVQQLADTVADAEGRPRSMVPDLGPGVVMDQLTVVVFDAGRSAAVGPARVAAQLARLRHTLTN